MATSFADILRQQQQLQQQQQKAQTTQGDGMGKLGKMGGKQLAQILRGGQGAASAAPAGGQAGFQLGQPLVSGQMGSSSMVGGGAGGFMPSAAPIAAAAVTAYNADRIGNEVGSFGDKLGLEKTSLPDQARAFGNFVKGDFGGAWGNLKDGVKNIFSIF